MAVWRVARRAAVRLSERGRPASAAASRVRTRPSRTSAREKARAQNDRRVRRRQTPVRKFFHKRRPALFPGSPQTPPARQAFNARAAFLLPPCPSIQRFPLLPVLFASHVRLRLVPLLIPLNFVSSQAWRALFSLQRRSISPTPVRPAPLM